MNEQIEKLKENLAKYYKLHENEKQVLRKVGLENCEALSDTGAWYRLQIGSEWTNQLIYRIKGDYQPEPATPEFEGYVLWPVDGNCYVVTYENGTTTRELISNAVNNCCVGYVFKEDPTLIWAFPILYVNETGVSETCLEKNQVGVNRFRPATLGWVAFKKT